jgi:lipoprotein-anchoring transpeptidase ErfK/SrfK
MTIMNEEEVRDGLDKKGLLFFLKALFFVGLLFLLADVGTPLILNSLMLHADTDVDPLQVRREINEIQAARHEREAKAEFEAKRILRPRLLEEVKITDVVPAHGKFLGADLDSMKLTLYEDGVPLKTFDIVAKGKPGSLWETPTGHYEIVNKYGTHFSSIGKVYMPYSMQFYGNFFIHGWPYYPSGKPVAKGFSGGCIRLETADAKEVYAFAAKGVPLFVWSSNYVGSETKTELINIPSPDVSAAAYIIADVNTGEVFLEKSINEEFPIASITKLMTAVVAAESMGLDRPVRFTERALQNYGDDGFTVGESINLKELLYPLLLHSSNDAASAIAYNFGEAEFLKLMNKKAKALGMEATVFFDASGIDDRNTSTVHDLFLFAQYLNNSKKAVLDITKIPTKKVYSSFKSFTLRNKSLFASDPAFGGGKTGKTDAAKETYVSLFETTVEGVPRTLAFVILYSDNRDHDIIKLREWFRKVSTGE